MKILVCLKQIPDPEVAPRDFRLDENNLIADPASAGLVTNIFCENALETALQLKEAAGGEITVLTFGPAEAEDVLRKALAVRADHAVHVINPGLLHPGSSGAACVLSAAIRKLGSFDLLMFGREAGDWGEGQTAGLVAEHLGLPFVAFVDSLQTTESGLHIVGQTDSGREELTAAGPVVVSITNSDANVPRIPKTRDIMMAHRRDITTWSLEDIDLTEDLVREAAGSVEVTELFIPEKDTTCEFITGDSADERIDAFARRIVDVIGSI